MLFRARLQALLAERDLSQRQLALATGVSQQTINNYLRGVTKLPGAEELLALSRYFGVPMEDFLTDDNNKAGSESTRKPASKSSLAVSADEVRRAAERMQRHGEELCAEAERLKRLSGGS